jgi:hypothetical protein
MAEITAKKFARGKRVLAVVPAADTDLVKGTAVMLVVEFGGATLGVLHLTDDERRGLINALGGTVSGLPDDALPDADERARQRSGVDR